MEWVDGLNKDAVDTLKGPVEGRGGLVAVLEGDIYHLLPGLEVHCRPGHAPAAYIEEHLTEEIDYIQLGRLACCSAYHYQRMFAYMAGVSLGEYIRRRRMSRAAVDLQSGGNRHAVAPRGFVRTEADAQDAHRLAVHPLAELL